MSWPKTLDVAHVFIIRKDLRQQLVSVWVPGTRNSAWRVGGAWRVHVADGPPLSMHGCGTATRSRECSILQVTEPSAPLSSSGRRDSSMPTADLQSQLWRLKPRAELPRKRAGTPGGAPAAAPAYKVKRKRRRNRSNSGGTRGIQPAPRQSHSPPCHRHSVKPKRRWALPLVTKQNLAGGAPGGPSLQQVPEEHPISQRVGEGMPRVFESSGFSATSFQKREGWALREGFPRTAHHRAFTSSTARNPSPPIVGAPG